MSSHLREQWQTFSVWQLVLNTFPDPIFVKDREHRWVAMNQAFCELVGQSYDQLFGKSDFDFWPAEQAQVFWEKDDIVFNTQRPDFNEEKATGIDGVERTIWTRKYPLFDQHQNLIGLTGIITDITVLADQRAQVADLEREIATKMSLIQAQREMLDELTVPVISLWQDILLLPLFGSIDSRRAQNITTSVLEEVQREQAKVLIVDLTGIPVVDTAVAGHLIRTIEATRLLGCRSILVGIRPEIAQTMVSLGIGFQLISSFSSLETGLQWAIHTINTPN